MIIYLSLLIALIGLLIYAFSANPANTKLQEVGKIMFFAGLLAFLITAPGSKSLTLP
jgi:hypothetical protein